MPDSQPPQPAPAVAEDAELIRRYTGGEAAAFDELVRRHRPGVLRAAWRATRNLHDAEDVTQQCFIDLARRLETPEGGKHLGPLTAWLSVVVRRRVIDVQRRRPLVPLDTQLIQQQAPDGELNQQVRMAVSELHEPYRQVVRMHYFDGRSEREIARLLRLSRRSISKLLDEARHRLLQNLAFLGVAASAIEVPSLLRAAKPSPKPAVTPPGRWTLTIRGPGFLLKPSALTGGLSALLSAALFFVIVAGSALVVADSRDRPGTSSAYELFKHARIPYTVPGDPYGFPAAVAAAAAGPSDFWVEGSDYFFDQLGRRYGHWLERGPSQVISPGVVHPRRLASYVTDRGPNLLSYGFADFADSAELPAEVDWLSGLVSLHLETSSPQSQHLDIEAGRKAGKRFLDAYTAELKTPTPPQVF